MSSDAGPLWGQIILLVVLIAVNAYFAAAEIAMVSANRNRIKTLAGEGNKKAKALDELLDEPNTFLSAIQVIITLAGFWNSAEAAVSLSGYVSRVFHLTEFAYGERLSVFIVTVLLFLYSRTWRAGA